MPSGFSAYLSIFNDWDILPDALRTIAPYVDEIVVVDGAYRWMAPYFEAIGIDPLHSDGRVRAALEQCGVKHRFINRLWENELEKRMAGYEACSGRFIFRIDADEILLIHEDRLARFLSSGAAVAAMEMPIVAAPGLIRVVGPDTTLEWQSLLFDRRQIGTAAHLRHLWLVLGPEGLPDVAEPQPPLFPEPIAFNSHLTEWRTPDTSRVRAAFYTLNSARTEGMGWTAWLRGTPMRDLAAFFRELVPPAAYLDVMLTSTVAIGEVALKHKSLRAAPYGTGADPRIGRLHAAYLDSLASLNRETASTGRHFVNGETIVFDLTDDAALGALCQGDTIELVIPAQPINALAMLYHELPTSPWETLQTLATTLASDRVTIRLPPRLPREAFLRCRLAVRVWCALPGPVHRFSVGGA